MNNLFTFFIALITSMAIIPLMVRLAPRLGMLDYPDERKVHVSPIPRVGGVGIIFGALIPVVMWLPFNETIIAYLFGSIIILLFGIWDDISVLGHRGKFFGQLIAVIAVVYYGDLYVTVLPLTDLTPLPEYIAKPFTVFAIVGMINALNVSDGLDGLAGGLSILSAGCIAYLAIQTDDYILTTLIMAMLGGVLGFLRYNTYPARVFMGDSGSQFIGFTLGFLAVYLTQRTNPALSPALPLLFLGLPIVDLLAAIAQRVYYKISPFAATKHHIHHRLMELGFDHYEAVVIIYSIQALFVISAIVLNYESDWLILLLYLGVCALLLTWLLVFVRKGWKAHKPHTVSRLAKIVGAVKRHKMFVIIPVWFVNIAIAVLFLMVAILANSIPQDLGMASTVLAVILLLYLLLKRKRDSIVLRAIGYVTAAFVVYVETKYVNWPVFTFATLETVYFVLLAVAIGLIIRYTKEKQFVTTPMDYLVILIVVFSGILFYRIPDKAAMSFMAVKLIIVFYGCELIFTHAKRRWNTLKFSTLIALVIFAVRGVL